MLFYQIMDYRDTRAYILDPCIQEFWLLKLILTENIFKIASKPTSIVTILAIITLAGDHIFQVLGQYL